jgi:hypothetical protein
MRYLMIPAILSTILVFTPSAHGENPGNRSTTATVETLIEQLGNKDFHVRESASKSLSAMGIDILPALRRSRSTLDPEVRRRLEELIPPLERAVALTPRRITLHMNNKTSRDVLAEFSKQTGYKLATWPDPQANGEKEKAVYTFHFDKLTFWEALDKLCETTGLVLQQNYGDDSLRLFYQDCYVPFVCYNGPFRVVATGFNYSRNNNFGQLPRNPIAPSQQTYEALQVNLMVAVEPKLPILRLGMVKVLSAEDDDGHSMLPISGADPNEWAGTRHYYGGYYRNYVQSTQANLVWPSKTSKTVKSMKGLIPVTLLAEQKPTVVTDKLLSAKSRKFQAGPASFTFEDVSGPAGNQYQVKMSVAEEARDGNNDYSQIQSLQQRIEVQDEKGNKIPSYFNMVNWHGPSSAQFTMTIQPSPPKVGPPSKLVYYSWVLMEHEVVFEFKDLPLP